MALTRIYVAALLSFGLILQIANPVAAGDTDMWYHLSGGQEFWRTGEVPNTTFFSFIEPERVWTNYFWGFQALVFKLHEFGGYQALILFRALMFFILTGVIALFVFHDEAWKKRPFPVLLLFVLIFLIVDGRAHQIRPHLFSYAFIAVFIYILEYKPRWTPTLPLLTVLWANAHGVEYVVGALICGAYFLETAILRFVLKRKLEDRNLLFLLSLAACAFAVLVNPHGPAILLTPFVIPDQIDNFIYELQPLSKETFLLFVGNPSLAGAIPSFFILLMAAVAACFVTLIQGNGRISHILLALGGFFLLTKGIRFIWEWALLTLPLLSSLANALAEQVRHHRSLVKSTLLLSLLCAPFLVLANAADKHVHYPLDVSDLPVGISRFLAASGLTGNLVTQPTQAGYVQWKLNPRILIHSNMELPPFDSPSLFEILNAYRNANSMRHLLSRYDVHFISVRRENRDFPDVIATFAEFKPVFFDDQQVLYASEKFFPAFVSQNQLSWVDPFHLFEERRHPNRQILELKRIYATHPEGKQVNHALVRLLYWSKDYAGALEHARALAYHHPRNPYGDFWLGSILQKTGRCAEAITHFEAAVERAHPDLARLLYGHIGKCHVALEDYPRAYRFLSKALNPILYPVDSDDLYLLALSASRIGRDTQAISALQMLLSQEAGKESELRARAERLLTRIHKNNGKSARSFSRWLQQVLDS